MKKFGIVSNETSFSFNTHKFSDRLAPGKSDIIIICVFSEFGCETLVPLYCIPRIIACNPGKYVIVVGWYGRKYLYQHLVDEFWELKEEYQYLRDTCRAFHHQSKSLKCLETELKNKGTVIPSAWLGTVMVGEYCGRCQRYWKEKKDFCPYCGNEYVYHSMFRDPQFWKERAVKLPEPSKEKMEEARQYIKPNSVGVFARNRKTYARNLNASFYVKLVKSLREQDYEPVWLGEKQSTSPCPVGDVIDFSRMPESRDLELTLAIIKQCQFTVQFWTASSRLAGMMGVPFLLFESANQVVGSGQEGYRLALTTFGNRKIVYSHFHSVANNEDDAISLVNRSIEEMQQDNWTDVIGLVDNEDVVKSQINGIYPKLGWQ